MDKVCKFCKFEGDASIFEKNRLVCKCCQSAYQKKYRQNNKSKICLLQQEWRNNNDLKNKKLKYYEENKQLILEKQKKYYLINSKKIKEKNSKYRKNNKDKRNRSESYRRANDPNYKLRVYFSRDIFRSVKSKNGLSALNILPYSILELRNHLEKQFDSWMTWNNHGKYNFKTWNDNDQSTWTWNIDHIIPRSSFSYSNINDCNFIKCWSLYNLRPLSSKINLINGSKLKRKSK